MGFEYREFWGSSRFLGAIGAGVLHVLQLLFLCFSVSSIGFGFRSGRDKGVALNLKALLLSRLLSALLIDTLNLLG